jgi:3'-phosphoadenosine 5'-phosphosulfate sulfotransferase (PAPS reductase)/FAD synthetase
MPKLLPLQIIPTIRSLERVALETIDEACEQFKCFKVFSLFSGGDDSLAALCIAREHPRFVAAVHCNTGIGVEATRDFVRETCRKLQCPLIEYKAVENVNKYWRSDPQIYEQMVMEYGFPGPTKFGHGKMYSRLKERGLRRLFREHCRRGEHVVLASGCRQDESIRRMGTTCRIRQGENYKSGRTELRRIWVNHIFDWTKTDTLRLREHRGLPRNPVAKLICKSGECMCGGFGNKGELEELCMHDLTRPLGKYLLDLEYRVIAAGFPWRWHEGPPEWWLKLKPGELFLSEMSKYGEPGEMCQKCEWRAKALREPPADAGIPPDFDAAPQEGGA